MIGAMPCACPTGYADILSADNADKDVRVPREYKKQEL
jgi:hypothetical protein